jgi:hypothetical protein
MLAACWRDAPTEGRTYKSVQGLARRVFERNVRVWNAIRKPTPGAFFENLLPNPADGLLRQALVLCRMMMPRGKNTLADVGRVVTHVFERNLAAWDEDYDIFTKGLTAGRRRPARAAAAPAGRKRAPAKKKKTKKAARRR